MNTGNNSGAVPDRVLNSAYWLDKQQLSQIRVSGLNHSKRYRFGFTGSSSPNGWFKGNYTATYTINDQTVYLNSWSNTTKVVYIDDVRPDENGEVMLNFSTTKTAVYGFNSGIIIEEYKEPQAEFITSMVNRTNDDLMVEQPIVDSVRNEPEYAEPRIYPNPFKDFINIDFYNTDPGKEVGVYVYDLSGRLLHSREFRNLPQGNQSIKLNTLETNIGTGVFMVMLKSGDKVIKVNKLMRIK
jgi:large repetitive protein